MCSGIFQFRELILIVTLIIGSFIRLQVWNSYSIGNGSWITDGVVTNNVATQNTISGKVTTVQCSATHLTSFAVLVNVAGGLEV